MADPDPRELARRILELDSSDRDHAWVAREIYEPAVRLAIWLLGEEAARGGGPLRGRIAVRGRQRSDDRRELGAAVGARLVSFELVNGPDRGVIGMKLGFEREDLSEVEVSVHPAGVQLVVGAQTFRTTDSAGRWRTRRDGVTEIRP